MTLVFSYCEETLSFDYERQHAELAESLAGYIDFPCSTQTSWYIAPFLSSCIQEFGVQGYPTIKVFGEDKDSPSDYQGGRDGSSLIAFVMAQWKKTQPPPEVMFILIEHMHLHCLVQRQGTSNSAFFLCKTSEGCKVV